MTNDDEKKFPSYIARIFQNSLNQVPDENSLLSWTQATWNAARFIAKILIKAIFAKVSKK